MYALDLDDDKNIFFKSPKYLTDMITYEWYIWKLYDSALNQNSQKWIY